MNDFHSVALVAAMLVLGGSALAGEKPKTGAVAPTQDDEVDATIRELEAQKKDADPKMRSLLDQQIEALRSAKQMKQDAQASAPKIPRAELSAEAKKLFTPAAPVAVPAWIADDAKRSDVSEAMMKCPAGAKVYFADADVTCAIPGVPGKSLTISHGLSLHFNSLGRLETQTFYDKGLVRWSIGYHQTGGRSSAGFYDGTEAKSYRESGLHTSWAPNGTIVSQTSFSSGVRDGWSKQWEDDGAPIGATRYEKGKAVERVLADGSRAAP